MTACGTAGTPPYRIPRPRAYSRVMSRRTGRFSAAGACGLSFARRIAELRPDDTVIVVEGMRVGYGTSGRNAGFMLRHHSHGGIKDLDAAKRSDRFFQTGQSYLRDIVEQHQIRCDWSDWGQIYVSASAPGEAHLDDVADGFNTLGIANEALDQDAVEAITGTRFYTRGVRVESGGALVQPAAMMRGLGETLPTNVTLYEDSPVTEIRSDGGFTRSVPTAPCARRS